MPGHRVGGGGYRHVNNYNWASRRHWGGCNGCGSGLYNDNIGWTWGNLGYMAYPQYVIQTTPPPPAPAETPEKPVIVVTSNTNDTWPTWVMPVVLSATGLMFLLVIMYLLQQRQRSFNSLQEQFS